MRLFVQDDAASVLSALQHVSFSESGLMVRPMRVFEHGQGVLVLSTELLGAYTFLKEHPAGGVLFLSPSAETAVRLVQKQVTDTRHLAVFGMRDWTPEALALVRGQRLQCYSMVEISREGLSEMADAVMSYVRGWQVFYLVVDLALADSAHGVHATPGGMSSRELLYLVQRLSLISTLCGAEVLVSAIADARGEALAARVAAELIVSGKPA
jgi:arginase family enzyme